MRAVLIEQFGVRPIVTEVPDPAPDPAGVVVEVVATGLCRSDWHGWLGHDPDIVLPHVPGHEFAGIVAAVGRDVANWKVGDRVTAPFVCACGRCAQCASGNQQTCLEQQQPGFTYWGSFAEFVAVPQADVNLVALPDGLGFDAAAALGCRFATAYRAIRQVGAVAAGEWVAVFGCGGVGLSAVMIAAAVGARVIAIDTQPDALHRAAALGAQHLVTAGPHAADDIRALTAGGAQVSLDALGSAEVIRSALLSLAPRGRHVQVGLLPEPVTLDLGVLVGRELQWRGSHGLSARDYPGLLGEVSSGALRPADLVGAVIGLEDAPAALMQMSAGSAPGMTVLHPRAHSVRRSSCACTCLCPTAARSMCSYTDRRVRRSCSTTARRPQPRSTRPGWPRPRRPDSGGCPSPGPGTADRPDGPDGRWRTTAQTSPVSWTSWGSMPSWPWVGRAVAHMPWPARPCWRPAVWAR
jgi:alcohol dehydrogenase